MHSFRGTPLALTLVALMACGGGAAQRPRASCAELSRSQRTAASADALGYPASAAIDAMLAERAGDGQRVWLTAPVELWTDHGAQLPTDRSGLGALAVETTAIEEVVYEPGTGSGWNDFCASTLLAVSLQATLTLEDLDASLTASGTLWLAKGELPGDLDAELAVAGWDVRNDCRLVPGTDPDVFSCGFAPVYATTRCLDPAERSGIDSLQADTATLLAEANRRAPLELSCSDGTLVELSYELRAPSDFCPMLGTTNLAPAVASLESAELGLEPTNEVSTILSGSCDSGFPGCGNLVVLAPLRLASDHLNARFDLAIDEDGSPAISAELQGRSEPARFNTTAPARADGLPHCKTPPP